MGSHLLPWRYLDLRKILAVVSAAGLSTTLLAAGTDARVYYVDSRRGNDSAPGTKTEPFKSITRASKLAEPGDKVLIGTGIYHEQIIGGKSGLEGSPITYEGADRSKVILQGSVLVKEWQRRGNVWVHSGLRPITPENAFVMVDEKRMLRRVPSTANMPGGSFHLGADGTYTIRLQDGAHPNRNHVVEVYELDFAFNSGDRWNGTAKSWIVLRNMTLEKYGGHGISTDSKHPADNSHWVLDSLIVRYNRAEGVFHCLDDWYVHDCTFMRNGVHGCQLDGARIQFVNNLCTENEWFGPSGNGGCGILIGPDESAHSCEIRDNVFSDNGVPNGYGCGIYLEGRSHDNLIEDNLIIGGTSSGIGFFGSSYNKVINNVLVNVAPTTDSDQAAAFVVNHSFEGAPTQSVGNLVAHNTICGCPAPLAVMRPKGIVKSTDLNRFVNNLFADCRHLSPVPESPPIRLEANGFFSCPEKSGGNKEGLSRWLSALSGNESIERLGNVVGDDAGFQNPAAGDFHLRHGSPAIRAGVPLSELTLDKDHNLRPRGRRPTLGAYEYLSAAGRASKRSVSP